MDEEALLSPGSSFSPADSVDDDDGRVSIRSSFAVGLVVVRAGGDGGPISTHLVYTADRVMSYVFRSVFRLDY